MLPTWLRQLVRRYPTPTRNRCKPRRSRPRLEELEPRTLLAANLHIADVLLTDRNGNPLSAVPVVGEMTFVGVRYTTTDLTAEDEFFIRFEMDGIPLDSPTIAGTAGTGVSRELYDGGWIASAGQHTITVTLDAGNEVAEQVNDDNTLTVTFTPAAPASLPSRFLWPLGGKLFDDYSIWNYVDVDPRPDMQRDYRGGSFVYDGHNGLDIAVANFARMDAGLPVYAAAAGTVVKADDDHFDRHTGSNVDTANYVKIDHGNGWETRYLHLARNTITVADGDVLAAGQLLGLIGSSGNSTDAHLHFSVYHNGSLVEPFCDPSAYWFEPQPYTGDEEPTTLDFGITNYDPGPDFKEHPSEIDHFPATHTGAVWFWTRLSHVRTGDVVTVELSRPGGPVVDIRNGTAGSDVGGARRSWSFGQQWSAFPGTWEVALRVNGEAVNYDYFVVQAGAAGPEIRVGRDLRVDAPDGSGSLTGNPWGPTVLDGRTTPIDFGSHVGQSTAAQQTFIVRNHGSATLQLSNLELPPGFVLMGSFPSTVAAGSTATFKLQLDFSRPGAKFGQVRFQTNDSDEGTYGFNVRGTVVGRAPVGAPVLTLPGPAVAYTFGQAPRVLDAAAQLTDSDSAHFGGGSLKVEFASGGTTGDDLGIALGGKSLLAVTFSSTLTYHGIPIGTVSGTGTPASPLVVSFTSSATLAWVQTVVRSITFGNAEADPGSAPRYVRFTLRDGTGKVSNLPIKVLVLAPHYPLPQANVGDIQAGSSWWKLGPAQTGQTDSLPVIGGAAEQVAVDAALWGDGNQNGLTFAGELSSVGSGLRSKTMSDAGTADPLTDAAVWDEFSDV